MELMKQGFHAGVVVVLFLIAMTIDLFTPLHNSDIYPMIAYLACCLVGIVPILTAAYIAIRRKQVRDVWKPCLYSPLRVRPGKRAAMQRDDVF
jgi:hypothetical protein